MEESFPIGNVTFLANIDPAGEHLWTNEDLEFISGEILNAFRDKLAEAGLDKTILIAGTSWRRGCLMEVITLALSASTLAAIYKGVKDYKSLRESVALIFKDLGNVVLKIRKRLKTPSKSTVATKPDHILDATAKGIIVYSHTKVTEYDKARTFEIDEYAFFPLAAFADDVKSDLLIDKKEKARVLEIVRRLETSDQEDTWQ